MKTKSDDPVVPEDAWAALIENYGLLAMDEFDQSIINVIERGYVEETGLSDAAEKLDAQARIQQLSDTYTKAWDLYHDSFKDNETELVSALEESFAAWSGYLTVTNLNGTARLLRELGRNEQADSMIERYIERRRDEPKLFDLANDHFGSEINDETLRRRFGETLKAFTPQVPLLEAMNTFVEGNGWSNQNVAAIARATEEDFYTVFKEYDGPHRSKFVRVPLQLGNEPQFATVRSRALAALQRIGAESRLNSSRVAHTE